jgi:LuxR family transcriptional regulator, maltose regulon positive regulatory protein
MIGSKADPGMLVFPSPVGSADRSSAVRKTRSHGWDLLVTKLTPPEAGSALIERPRLIDALSAARPHQVTLVQAPLGWGKTTLVADWWRRIPRDGAVIAWLSLEDSENDPALFWRHVVAALRAGGSAAGGRAETQLSAPGADLDRAVGSLLNDLALPATPTTLVLDDYDAIREPRCHELLARFLDHLPTGLRVVLVTRSDPPLPLGSIRAAGRLAELRERDLRMTADEAAEFVRASGVDVTNEELGLLMARTEGWAAGLRLATLWLTGEPDRGQAIRHFAGDNRHLADYLNERLLAGLDPEIESSLLQTSMVARMSAPLCEALTGDPRAADLLGRIERAGLPLLPLDGRRQWYRYHHLFAGWLQAELARRSPDLVPVLHRRACDWHRRHGHPRDAFEHAMSAGDHAVAAEIVGGSWVRMLRSGGSATLRRWLERLPSSELRTAPALCYIGAFATGLAGATEAEVERWLSIAKTERSAGADAIRDGGGPLRIGADFVHATFVYQDIPAAAAAAQRVANLQDGGGWRVPALAALAFLRYLSGDVTAARAAVSDALMDRGAPFRPHGGVHALATLALLELEDGEAEKASRSARRALEVAGAAGLDGSVIAGIPHTALGLALIAVQRRAEGMLELQAGVACLRGRAPVAAHVYALLCLAEAHLAGGDFVAAQRAADAADVLIDPFENAGILTAKLAELRRRSQMTRRRRRAGPTTDVSQSELAVLRLLAGQKSRAGIAAELMISPNTVKTHVASVYRKLGVGSRTEAVSSARQRRLL